MNSETRGSYVFYRSFMEALNEASPADRLLIYEAISAYALDRIEPQLEGTNKAIWVLIKPQLDANWRRYTNGVKGGAPKGSANNPRGRRGNKTTSVEPITNQEVTINKPNDNVNDNVNDNHNDFIKPTLSEVESFISKRGYKVSAKEFYSYYTANGWKLGQNPMASWRATLYNWHCRNNDLETAGKAY